MGLTKNLRNIGIALGLAGVLLFGAGCGKPNDSEVKKVVCNKMSGLNSGSSAVKWYIYNEDLNNDGLVNISDVEELIKNYLFGDAKTDLNRDKVVNGFDHFKLYEKIGH